jgi:hypothetical protein
MRYLALFPFSSSHVLSLSSYILSYLSMIMGYNIGGITYLHLHLYPHMMNLTNHCSFPYLANFMAVVGTFELSCFLFHDIHLALKTFMIYNSTVDSLTLFPFSSSRVLSLSSYILSFLSMIVGSNIGELTYLHLHLYPHMMNLTDHCSFPYLDNFMAMVVRLALLNSATSCSMIYILALSNSTTSCSMIYILHSEIS